MLSFIVGHGMEHSPESNEKPFNSIQKHLFKHDMKNSSKLLMWSCVYQYSKIYSHKLC